VGASWYPSTTAGGVGIGYSQHSGQVTVADEQREAKRIERCVTNDREWIVRHVGCGVSEAIAFAKKTGVKVPHGVALHGSLGNSRIF